MAEELERQEADRKLQAEKLKNKMEVRNCVIWVVCGPQFAGTLEIDLIERCVLWRYVTTEGVGGWGAIGSVL